MEPEEIRVAVLETLKEELRLSVYDRLSAEAAYDVFVNGPVTSTETEVPVKPSLVSILQGLSAESLQKIVHLPCVLDIRDSIVAGDLEKVRLWGQTLVLSGVISISEGQAIAEVAARTEVQTNVVRGPARQLVVFSGKSEYPNLVEFELFQEAWQLVRG